MKLCRSTLRSKQKNQEKKIIAVPLYSGPVEMLAIPPCGASSNIALWRAKIKPPVELVVGELTPIRTKKWPNLQNRKPHKPTPQPTIRQTAQDTKNAVSATSARLSWEYAISYGSQFWSSP